jgi:HSP20 family protein
MDPMWVAPEPWGVEVEELEREVVYRFELPGFAPGEIDVRVTGNLLTVTAEHPATAEAPAAEPAERHCNRLQRTYTLPEGIVPEAIEARYLNGLLEVHVLRTPEAQPRRIEVKT